MIGFLPTPVPAVQAVGGVARNESIYDTEMWQSGVNLQGTQIQVFANFAAFATVTTTPAGVTKQPGRDTNLSGAGQSGLPQGVQHFAYAWSNEIHTMDADLNLFASQPLIEQMNRLRRLTFAALTINQTNAFITERLSELVAFEDSLHYQTTHGAVTVVSPVVGDRKGKSMTSTQRYQKAPGQVVTVKNSPYIFQPLQAFRVIVQTPAVAAAAQALTLARAIACVMKFRGITVRGIS